MQLAQIEDGSSIRPSFPPILGPKNQSLLPHVLGVAAEAERRSGSSCQLADPRDAQWRSFG